MSVLRKLERKNLKIFTAASIAMMLLLSSGGGLIHAEPTSQQKRQELERIKNEVNAIDAQLSNATEQYNLACARVEQTQREIAENEAKLDELNAKLAEYRSHLDVRLKSLYIEGNMDIYSVLMECEDISDFLNGAERIRILGVKDSQMISETSAVKAEAEAISIDLNNKKAILDSEKAKAASTKNQIESELARRRQLMAGVEAEVNRLIQEEDRRREQAAAQNPGRSGGVTRPPVNYTPPPPPSPDAPRVVQIAYAQLGKPYQYAGRGPNVFDCSGLMVYCYAQIGISLPHSSYMQINVGRRVSYADLAPGDLVFFRGFGHVGMYVGGGQYLHAPRTGDVVRVASLSSRSDFCGATRIL